MVQLPAGFEGLSVKEQYLVLYAKMTPEQAIQNVGRLSSKIDESYYASKVKAKLGTAGEKPKPTPAPKPEPEKPKVGETTWKEAYAAQQGIEKPERLTGITEEYAKAKVITNIYGAESAEEKQKQGIPLSPIQEKKEVIPVKVTTPKKEEKVYLAVKEVPKEVTEKVEKTVQQSMTLRPSTPIAEETITYPSGETKTIKHAGVYEKHTTPIIEKLPETKEDKKIAEPITTGRWSIAKELSKTGLYEGQSGAVSLGFISEAERTTKGLIEFGLRYPKEQFEQYTGTPSQKGPAQVIFESWQPAGWEVTVSEKGLGMKLNVAADEAYAKKEGFAVGQIAGFVAASAGIGYGASKLTQKGVLIGDVVVVKTPLKQVTTVAARQETTKVRDFQFTSQELRTAGKEIGTGREVLSSSQARMISEQIAKTPTKTKDVFVFTQKGSQAVGTPEYKLGGLSKIKYTITPSEAQGYGISRTPLKTTTTKTIAHTDKVSSQVLSMQLNKDLAVVAGRTFQEGKVTDVYGGFVKTKFISPPDTELTGGGTFTKTSPKTEGLQKELLKQTMEKTLKTEIKPITPKAGIAPPSITSVTLIPVSQKAKSGVNISTITGRSRIHGFEAGGGVITTTKVTRPVKKTTKTPIYGFREVEVKSLGRTVTPQITSPTVKVRTQEIIKPMPITKPIQKPVIKPIPIIGPKQKTKPIVTPITKPIQKPVIKPIPIIGPKQKDIVTPKEKVTPIIKPITKPITKQITKTKPKTITRTRTSLISPPKPPTPVFPARTRFIGIKGPLLPPMLKEGFRKPSKPTGLIRERKYRYTPSLTAAAFGITGKPSKKKFTGLELRPIPRSKKRKKKEEELFKRGFRGLL
jgi:hypothetical protein